MDSALYVNAWIKDVQGRGNLPKSTEKNLLPNRCFLSVLKMRRLLPLGACRYSAGPSEMAGELPA
jgi:hypothetical protein